MTTMAATTPATTRGDEVRATAGLPLPYLSAALVALLVFSAGIPLLAPELIASSSAPHVLGLTHVIVLGWVTMVMIGALHQLLPVALRATLWGPGLARAGFWLYAGSVAGFAPSVFFWWLPGMAVFGTLAVLAVLVFCFNLLASYRSVQLWHAMAFYVLAGVFWLLLTIGLGGSYALDHLFHWFAITDSRLAVHAQLGLAGWASLVLMGVSYKLTEMFSLAHGQGKRLRLWNLGLWNAALSGLLISAWLAPSSRLVPSFATGLLVSAGIFVFDIGRTLRHRRRRTFSLDQWHAFVSLASFLVAALMGVLLAARHPLTATWTVTYGWVVLAGWFGFAIIGKQYKIVPFLTWLRRFSRVAGGSPAPLLREMVDSRTGWVSFALLLAGYAGVAAGLATGRVPIVEGAGAVYALGAWLFVFEMVRLIRPGSRPRPVAAAPRHATP